MSFTAEQVAALQADLNRQVVRQRKQAGRQLSYIEGWWAEAEANRIFGHHAWDSETVELRMVAEKPRKIGDAGVDGWSVSYLAKVRVTVVTPTGHKIVREGIGAGHGIDRDLGLAHESAAKEAETDAEKRALKTFGNPFGLALYDKTQAHVSDEPPPSGLKAQLEASVAAGRKIPAQAKRDGDHERIRAMIDGADAGEALELLKTFDQWTYDQPAQWLDAYRDRLELRIEELNGKAKVKDAEAELDAGFRGSVGPSRSNGVARNASHLPAE